MADEIAKHDENQVKVNLAIDKVSWEVRMVRSNNAWQLQVEVASIAAWAWLATEAKQDDAITELQAIWVDTANIDTQMTDKTQFTKLTDWTDDVDVEEITDRTLNLDWKKWLVVQAVLNGRYWDDNTRPIEIDDLTHSINIIDYAHHEIHAWSHYTLCQTDSDLDSGQTIDILITAPDTTKWLHMVASAYWALHTRLEIYEDCTHTDDTTLTAQNNNRNSANTSWATFATSNNDWSDWTLIFESEWWIDTWWWSNRRSWWWDSRWESEWILKQDTKYMIRVESLTANNVGNLCLSWYEHTNRT